ncbi:hypothetical protein AB0M39_00250 [Streptomyces sp. NPDC051907]|uniref:hypothetical protein n=1 Tax=Streptomyces sp. NPDC051907 TaxID=3155284 RepID=UPI0034396E07
MQLTSVRAVVDRVVGDRATEANNPSERAASERAASDGASSGRLTPSSQSSSGQSSAGAAPAAAPRGRNDADGMAVAAFVLGLVGLLVMNIVLGPIAVVLAALALWRGTARRFRAWLGLALGLADLAVLAVLVTVNGNVVWGFGG